MRTRFEGRNAEASDHKAAVLLRPRRRIADEPTQSIFSCLHSRDPEATRCPNSWSMVGEISGKSTSQGKSTGNFAQQNCQSKEQQFHRSNPKFPKICVGTKEEISTSILPTIYSLLSRSEQRSSKEPVPQFAVIDTYAMIVVSLAREVALADGTITVDGVNVLNP